MQRSKTRSATMVVALATVALLVTGCGSSSKSDNGASATTTMPSGPAPVTITAGDYTFQGVPKTMTAGIQDVTFVNQGEVQHEMVMVKVKPGTTKAVFFNALGQWLNGGPLPAFALAVNGIANTDSGATTVAKFNLSAGDYIAFCTDTGVAGSQKDGKPHYARGMYARFSVTGSGGDTAPTADATITARDYSFELQGLKAGEQTIAFKNDGPEQWHFADINVFPKGVTAAQARAAVNKLIAAGNGPPPPGVPQPAPVVTSQAASPGNGNTFQATLLAGRTYVVLCFISDKTGGPPHAIGHHMYKVFTIS